MILLDTCALVFDALSPKKLTATAKKAIISAEEKNQLFCSDISLWEIAMLVQKKRLEPGVDAQTFLDLLLQSRSIEVLPISTEIAVLSTTHSICDHSDPADRIIAATAIHYHASLVTSDKKLRDIPELRTIW